MLSTQGLLTAQFLWVGFPLWRPCSCISENRWMGLDSVIRRSFVRGLISHPQQQNNKKKKWGERKSPWLVEEPTDRTPFQQEQG
ncbi:hypothetical protein QBC44DRAFT_323005 [Cladorrhinum sp. PSN332]|nr:hypothetical protein QBC44DRAFT_323005 [Cladorrhinum sp. PSN332]